jgi:hypothetical protein
VNKTWSDVEEAAMGRPWTDAPFLTLASPYRALFHQAVTMVELGQMTREEALIALSLALLDGNERQHAELVDAYNRRPPAPIILQGISHE